MNVFESLFDADRCQQKKRMKDDKKRSKSTEKEERFSSLKEEMKGPRDSHSIVYMETRHFRRTFLMRQHTQSLTQYLKVTMELSLRMDRQVLVRLIQWLEFWETIKRKELFLGHLNASL